MIAESIITQKQKIPLISLRTGLLVLLILGLVIRIFLFTHITPRLHTDSVTYIILGDLETTRTPGYPFFIEIIQFVNDVFSVSTDYFKLIIFVQMFLLGLANVMLIFLITYKLTDRISAGLAVGFIYNFTFFIIGFEFLILTETLAATLLLALIYFYIKIFENTSFAWAAGIFSLWLILTRPVFMLLFAGFILISCLIYIPGTGIKAFFRKYGRALIVVILISAAGIGGWSLRNKIVYNYFGLSSIMPFQLWHYTKHFIDEYNPETYPELAPYFQIFKEENYNYSRFEIRMQKEYHLNSAEAAQIFLKMNLALIKSHPKNYFRQIPNAAASYYMDYSLYWTARHNKKLLNNSHWISRVFLEVFHFFELIYSRIGSLIMMILLLPAAAIWIIRKNKTRLHLFLLIEGAIHYTFMVSVLTTNAGVNNLRYRLPVEPLILAAAAASVFIIGQGLIQIIKRHKSAVS